MNMRVQPSSLRWVKDRIIETGADRWVRPVWMKLTGQRRNKYDAELSNVMARVLKRDSTCIDIGAHKGTILDECMRHAPHGTSYGFELIPHLVSLLRRKYSGNPRVKLYEVALSDTAGTATFYVDTASMEFSSLRVPSRSGKGGPDIETCTVNLARLDDLLPEIRPDLIKIDRADRGLRTWYDRFGTTPEDVFDLLAGLGLQVSLLARYLSNQPPLSRSEFCTQFYSRLNYFFIAYP